MGKEMKRRDQPADQRGGIRGWMGIENNENELQWKKSLAVVGPFLDFKLF